MCDEDVQSLVIDLGSSTFKVGFAGYDDIPKDVIPSCVSRRRYHRSIAETQNKSSYVGHEAQTMRGISNVNYALSSSGIVDIDDYEKILHHCIFDILRVAPEEHPLLGVHANTWSLHIKEKATQIAFETFSNPAFYLVPQGITAIYASGRVTGLIVSVGESVCETYPIYEGNCPTSSIKTLDVAGKHLTEYFGTLLAEKGYSFTTSADMEAVRELKEKACYIPLNQQAEWNKSQMSSSLIKDYQLPDGEKISIGNESFRCPEALFKPDLLGVQDKPGIHELVYSSIMETDLDCRKDLCENIVIAGGSSLIRGFPERFEKELKKLLPSTLKVKVISPNERAISAWIGGSILGSITSFQQHWITKEEYDESGPQIIQRKCWYGHQLS